MISSDLITGNNFGDIGLVAYGRYISVKEQAHTKMINCLRVTEIYNEVIIIYYQFFQFIF